MKPIRHRRFCRKAIAVACASAAGWLETPAAAQQVPQQDAVELRGAIKIEVTGSNIRRSDVESALPVQVITREDIERGGFTTVAGVIASVSANVGAFTSSSPGTSFRVRGCPASTCAALATARRWC